MHQKARKGLPRLLTAVDAHASLPALLFSSLCMTASLSHAQPETQSARNYTQAAVDLCLQQQVLDPINQRKTVTQIREECEQILQSDGVAAATDPEAVVEETVASTHGLAGPGTLAETSELKGFFRPYKDNYLVFGRMRMDDGSVPFSGEELDTKFELGLTFSLFEGRRNFDFLAPLHVGYSQKSWWDIAEDSAPFREHNYNPEIYWLFNQPQRPLVGRFPFVDIIGIEHQSNGQDGLESRSWDRVYMQKEFYLLPQLSIGVKLWDILSRDDANNDDIRKYLGTHQLSVIFRPNDRTNLRWRLQQGNDVDKLSYTFDVYYRRPNVNGAFFVQYHDGYGEALATYNRKTKSLRAGFYFPLDILD